MRFLVVLGVCALAAGTSAQGSCTGNGYKPDSTDCNKYYQCVNNAWVKMSCGSGLQWNQAGYCDWPASSGCVFGAPAPAPAPAPGPAPAPAPGQAPSGGLISQSEFQCAAQTKGGNPASSYYSGYIASLPKASITTKSEAAKFLAHAVWETVGFQYTKEVYCQNNMQACLNAYPNNQGGIPGKVYYGRGCLQLTWDYNYKAASSALYGDDRLLQNPDQVADNPEIAWATAAWYWKTAVHNNAGTFGGTLKAINGALECDGGSASQNRVLRFNHYKQVLSCLNMPSPPDSDGACSAW